MINDMNDNQLILDPSTHVKRERFQQHEQEQKGTVTLTLFGPPRDVDTNNNTNHHKKVGALPPMPPCLGIGAPQWVPARTPTVLWGPYDERLSEARPRATTPRDTTRTQTSLESIVSGETCAVLLSTCLLAPVIGRLTCRSLFRVFFVKNMGTPLNGRIDNHPHEPRMEHEILHVVSLSTHVPGMMQKQHRETESKIFKTGFIHLRKDW